MNNLQINLFFENIGYKLYVLRHSRREKISCVADYLGVSSATVSLIENGRYRSLSLILLLKIAEYYNVELSFLISKD